MTSEKWPFRSRGSLLRWGLLLTAMLAYIIAMQEYRVIPDSDTRVITDSHQLVTGQAIGDDQTVPPSTLSPSRKATDKSRPERPQGHGKATVTREPSTLFLEDPVASPRNDESVPTLQPSTLSPSKSIETLRPSTLAPLEPAATLRPSKPSPSESAAKLQPSTLSPSESIPTLQPSTLAPSKSIITQKPSTISPSKSISNQQVSSNSPSTLRPSSRAPTLPTYSPTVPTFRPLHPLALDRFERKPPAVVLPLSEVPINKSDCVVFYRRNTDGIGSTLQKLYPVFLYAMQANVTACLVRSNSMEHVSFAEMNLLFDQTGLIFRNLSDCQQCTGKAPGYQKMWGSLTDEYEKLLQDMYVTPEVPSGRGYRRFDPSKVNVVIHMRVQTPQDYGRRQPTYNPLLIRIMVDILQNFGGRQNVKFFIYSEEAPSKPYLELQQIFEVEVVLNETTLETFSAFVKADVFVMSESALAFIAAILNPRVIYGRKKYDLPLRGRYIVMT